ncbi:hypothetical protein VKT23_000260 [Stygiomarasmius scandens]|uniref:DDE-1 domain-containing protein n=1 Tax=Marasmiellus scandens TaxID=2682957 RepID=A0ABR1K3J5_9AGAR
MLLINWSQRCMVVLDCVGSHLPFSVFQNFREQPAAPDTSNKLKGIHIHGVGYMPSKSMSTLVKSATIGLIMSLSSTRTSTDLVLCQPEGSSGATEKTYDDMSRFCW